MDYARQFSSATVYLRAPTDMAGGPAFIASSPAFTLKIGTGRRAPPDADAGRPYAPCAREGFGEIKMPADERERREIGTAAPTPAVVPRGDVALGGLRAASASNVCELLPLLVATARAACSRAFCTSSLRCLRAK